MTDEPLPNFRYHPDPLATGMVTASEALCACCNKQRGYIYIGPVYAVRELREQLCPWCISSGAAASELHASFADTVPLSQAGVPHQIVEEVNLRTPGYISWQQESWLAHCNDACAYHGDASAADVFSASPKTKSNWIAMYHQDEAGWVWATEGYQPGGDSALYKFVCLHCSLVLFGWDLC